ncbi:MAG TPA: 16S rRNA (guanine(966)-N(2))-methyltransferase RsmD [Acidimicrobiales bacterium]|jgi:16S rRNA (guanine966-N2)-methyltransferase|nr:16S rRNA (guanine(966)-N(2))-methyltransferase RsmD [Acidimicrobiales bacterium]
MRVVGGSARGRRLSAPPGRQTRPTSDRVREAVFNMLESLGAVRDAVVADLFAGTGAMGIEALSRGAASAVFVDDDPVAVRTIRANVGQTGLNGAEVVRDDVLRWVEHAGPVDLAVIDPPYAFDRWPELLARLDADVAVLESDRPVEPGDGWEVLKEKRYGGTVVVLARRKKGGG